MGKAKRADPRTFERFDPLAPGCPTYIGTYYISAGIVRIRPEWRLQLGIPLPRDLHVHDALLA